MSTLVCLSIGSVDHRRIRVLCRQRLGLFVILVLNFCIAPSIVAQDTNYELQEGIVVDAVPVPVWTGSFASGLNGKSGNSESRDINMTLNLSRETDVATTALLASYFYGSNAIATVTDRAYLQGRQERKLVNDRWSWYVQGALEWDRFKAFDYRIALHSGFSFDVYKNDVGFLKTRWGSGASKEVGSANDDWSPELQIGADWERKLTGTTKIFATVDYYPNVGNFSDFRVNSNVGFNFLVDDERNINFRVFALNRYDSTPPPGTDNNDIDYGMALVLGF